MTRQVWKFPLNLTGSNNLTIPEGAEILDVQIQHGTVCLWALVDLDAPSTSREVFLAGTGHDLPAGTLTHLGTTQSFEGSFVFHAFEVTHPCSGN